MSQVSVKRLKSLYGREALFIAEIFHRALQCLLQGTRAPPGS